MINVGDKFGKLTIVEDLGCFIKDGTKTKKHYIKCQCECGNQTIVSLDSLKNKRTKSCGCSKKYYVSLASRKYNDYTTKDDYICVKMTNCNQYMLCDIDTWESLKKYSWCKSKNGYAVGYCCGKQVKFHQMVLEYDKSNFVIDHINGNKLDNRKCNLRIIDRKYNNMNLSIAKNNTSGVTGVSFNKKFNKWKSEIQVNRRRIFLGWYDKIDDAIKIRKEAEIKYFGSYRRNKYNTI